MIKIELNKKQSIFETGKNIKGIVKLESEDELLVHGVSIRIAGHEMIYLSKKIPLRKHLIHNDWKLLAGEEITANPDGTPDTSFSTSRNYLEPTSLQGNLSWEFCFEIPDDLPSTSKLENARIEYYLEVVVATVFEGTKTCVLPISIANRVSKKISETYDTRFRTQGNYYFLHTIDPTGIKKDIVMSASIVNPIVGMGDEIKIKLELDLRMKSHLPRIKAKLRQRHDLKLAGYSNIETLTKVTHYDYTKQLNSGMHEIIITMPMNHSKLSPSVTSKYIKCKHHISIIIPTQLTDDIVMKIPIIVERIPRSLSSNSLINNAEPISTVSAN